MTVSERGFSAPSRSMACSMRAISKSTARAAVADGEPAPDPSQEGNWGTALVFSLLSLTLLTPSLSPTGGEGGRRPGEGAFRGSRAQGARKVRGISLPGGEGRGEGERLIPLNSYDLVVSEAI